MGSKFVSLDILAKKVERPLCKKTLFHSLRGSLDANRLDAVAHTQRMHDIKPLDRFAEYRIFVVELGPLRQREIELAASRVGVGLMRHHDGPVLVMVSGIGSPLVPDAVFGLARARMHAVQYAMHGLVHLIGGAYYAL